MTLAPRGFSSAEFKRRIARAQQEMRRAKLDALLLTTEPEVRYFTGLLTRFWQSPTRPWCVVIPARGRGAAVVPSIGGEVVARTWSGDVCVWRGVEFKKNGLPLLAKTLSACTPKRARIGAPFGCETHIQMPMADFEELRRLLSARAICSDGGLTARLRAVKSTRETAKIANACRIAARAFARVGEIAKQGATLENISRDFQSLCLQEGADYVPYLAIAAGRDGYADVISPGGAQKLRRGDVLMLDTGLVWDGYFCDFNRNYAVGEASAKTRRAYALLRAAHAAGFKTARAGATAADVYAAMNAALSANGDAGGGQVGRLGHGLGMQLTEGLSIHPDDKTILQAGMVLTLEPSIATGAGRVMVHEENIVINKNGARLLSDGPPPEIEILQGRK